MLHPKPIFKISHFAFIATNSKTFKIGNIHLNLTNAPLENILSKRQVRIFFVVVSLLRAALEMRNKRCGKALTYFQAYGSITCDWYNGHVRFYCLLRKKKKFYL